METNAATFKKILHHEIIKKIIKIYFSERYFRTFFIPSETYSCDQSS